MLMGEIKKSIIKKYLFDYQIAKSSLIMISSPLFFSF